MSIGDDEFGALPFGDVAGGPVSFIPAAPYWRKEQIPAVCRVVMIAVGARSASITACIRSTRLNEGEMYYDCDIAFGEMNAGGADIFVFDASEWLAQVSGDVVNSAPTITCSPTGLQVSNITFTAEGVVSALIADVTGATQNYALSITIVTSQARSITSKRYLQIRPV